ncbi:unnamed protein product [Plutella xylostella]|uniref:(diamondback moth) hypothetical protein n=1 Tax=Plutella xylostella TaxID=51655 RepID=A0A8S4G7C4_PLUXY|nr:unnamed protein product [Plutella xylostella]
MDADDSEYWNTTQVKAFSFDDDILTTQEILAIGQRANLSSSQSDSEGFLSSGAAKPLLPLSSLVSPKVLDLILLAQSGKDPPSKQPKLADSEETVSITLKRLVLGRPCSLHTHRSLKSKTELLDGAVAIGDGNCIISVQVPAQVKQRSSPRVTPWSWSKKTTGHPTSASAEPTPCRAAATRDPLRERTRDSAYVSSSQPQSRARRAPRRPPRRTAAAACLPV